MGYRSDDEHFEDHFKVIRGQPRSNLLTLSYSLNPGILYEYHETGLVEQLYQKINTLDFGTVITISRAIVYFLKPENSQVSCIAYEYINRLERLNDVVNKPLHLHLQHASSY